MADLLELRLSSDMGVDADEGPRVCIDGVFAEGPLSMTKATRMKRTSAETATKREEASQREGPASRVPM